MLVIVGVFTILAILAFFYNLGTWCVLAIAYATGHMAPAVYGYERPLRNYQRVIVTIELLAIGLLWAAFFYYIFLYLRQFI